ncbi:unnamed protein product [Symbiodinium microadriaticum]|nr:unnamed protein product [Symbiodinium microadriaticum]
MLSGSAHEMPCGKAGHILLCLTVSELKQEAEELVRWLDPSYAHPASTPMAIQWAQNSSAVMISARFSHKWEAPGANLAVYSTEKGQGHVNKDRTAESVRRLLRVNITASRVEAEILAKVQNSRKRFTLDLNLFDETIPHASGWTVEFRKARGSMQMSRGAEIPELHIHMRKRWPSPDYAWPRLAEEEGAEMAVLEKEMQFSGPMLSESTLTCLRGGSLYCPASDSCASSCSGCQGLGQARGSRCGASLAAQLEAASAGDSLGGAFLDEDLQPEMLGGLFRWVHRPELLAAEAFALCWARPLDPSEATWKLMRPSDTQLVAWEVQDSDPWPQLQVPNGTYLPADARHLVLVALPTVPAEEELGGGLCSSGIPAAAASVMDRWRPAVEEMSLAFEDVDPQPMSLLGSAKLMRIAAKMAGTAAPALSFELRWGRQQQGWWLVGDDNSSLIAKAAADEDEIVMEVRSSHSSDAGVRIPRGATHLLVYALGAGGIRTIDPVAVVQFHDARPPTELPTDFKVMSFVRAPDGSASFTAHFEPGQCATLDRSTRGSDASGCEPASSHVVYWVDQRGQKLGTALWASDGLEAKELSITNASVPPDARGLRVLARNLHGEMASGPATWLPSLAEQDESERASDEKSGLCCRLLAFEECSVELCHV